MDTCKYRQQLWHYKMQTDVVWLQHIIGSVIKDQSIKSITISNYHEEWCEWWIFRICLFEMYLGRRCYQRIKDYLHPNTWLLISSKTKSISLVGAEYWLWICNWIKINNQGLLLECIRDRLPNYNLLAKVSWVQEKWIIQIRLPRSDFKQDICQKHLDWVWMVRVSLYWV